MFFTFEKSITKYAIVFLLANRSYITECSLFRYLAHMYVMCSECDLFAPSPHHAYTGSEHIAEIDGLS